jgi:hypothetical protein
VRLRVGCFHWPVLHISPPVLLLFLFCQGGACHDLPDAPMVPCLVVAASCVLSRRVSPHFPSPVIFDRATRTTTFPYHSVDCAWLPFISTACRVSRLSRGNDRAVAGVIHILMFY